VRSTKKPTLVSLLAEDYAISWKLQNPCVHLSENVKKNLLLSGGKKNGNPDEKEPAARKTGPNKKSKVKKQSQLCSTKRKATAVANYRAFPRP